MEKPQLAQLALLVILTADSVLLIGLIGLKAVHRRRVENHDRRRAGYVALLSRHLTIPHNVEPIGRRTAEDPAFLDALIDVRNAVTGTEIETLRGIVDRYGIADRLGRRLRSRFPLGRRLRAAVALAELGDESSVDVLEAHLGDREPEIRIQCARGLGRIRWSPAIDAIVERFSVETPWVRTRFADTLVGYGNRATWPLIAYIRVNHKFDHEGPALAIRTLATIGDSQAALPLAQILQESENVEIQLAAIESLGEIGGPLAVGPISEKWSSDDWRLRAKAATALGSIGARSALPFLVEGLEDANWWVRRNSAAGLAQMPEGVDCLYEALSSDDFFARDAAAEALVDIGELIAARERLSSGFASERDITLINHMNPELAVTA